MAGLLALSAWLLAGCSRPVAVVVPSSAPSACAAVMATLPKTLDGLDERDTSPASTDVRAWGDPPVVVRCGVDRPADYDPTAGCAQVNRVGWYEQPATDGSILTANWASPRVEVSLPGRYTPAAVLVAVSNAIAAQVEHPGCPD